MTPTFEILSLGDAAYLYTVINAVSGINSFGVLGALGAMIGLVLMAVQGMTANGGVQLDGKWILISIVAFWVMFVPRVDGVLIVELNTPPGYCGTVRSDENPEDRKWYEHGCAPRTFVVDNVPLGLAATGYIVSTLGTKVTQLFETTFGQAEDESRVTTGALGQHLRLLANLRMLQQQTFNDPKGDLEWTRYNLATYMHDCTLPAVSQRHLTVSQVMNGGGQQAGSSPLEAIKYAHPMWPTTLQVRDAGGGWALKEFDCATGWDYISANVPDLETAYMSALSPSEIQGTDSRPVTQVFMNLNSDIGNHVQEFMLANMITAVASRAAIEGPMNSDQKASVMMVEEAAAKRATQAAAEENIFTRLLRPTVSFFEALFYALSPLMAFLITTGAFGMKMVFKYLQMTLWVMLWFPLLAIVNLYTNMQMEQFVAALGSKALAPYDAWSVSAAAIDYLGTASTLAAATPALAMSLMYGGAVSMSYLAGRLQGSDVIDESKLTPDSHRVDPAMVQGASIMNDLSTGARFGQVHTQYSLGEAQQQQMSSRASERAASQLSFQHTQQSTLSKLEDMRNSESYKTDTGYRTAVDNALSAVVAVGKDATLDRTQKAEIGSQWNAQTGGSGSADASAGGGKKAGGGKLPGAGMAGSVGGQAAVTSRNAEGTGTGVRDNSRHSQEEKDALVRQAHVALQHVADVAHGVGISANDADSYARSASDSFESARAFEEVASRSSSIDTSLTFKDSDVQSMLERGAIAQGIAPEDARDYVHGLMADRLADAGGEAQDYYQQQKAMLEGRGEIADSDVAAAAYWRTFSADPATFSDPTAKDEIARGYGTMASLMSATSFGGKLDGAEQYRGVSGDRVQVGAAESAVQGNLVSSGVSREALSAGAASVAAEGASIDGIAKGRIGDAKERASATGPGLSYSESQRGEYNSSVSKMRDVEVAKQREQFEKSMESRSALEIVSTTVSELAVSMTRYSAMGAAELVSGTGARLPANDMERAEAEGSWQGHVEHAKEVLWDKSERAQQVYAAAKMYQDGGLVSPEAVEIWRSVGAGELDAEVLAFAGGSNAEMQARERVAKDTFEDAAL